MTIAINTIDLSVIEGDIANEQGARSIELDEGDRLELWVFTGYHLHESKLYQEFRETHDPEKKHWYQAGGKKSLISYASPGQVYWVVATEKSVYTGGKKMPMYAGKFHDESARQRWAARSRAVEVEFERIKTLKKTDEIDALIEPLRVRYNKIIGHKRKAAFLAYVIEQMTAHMSKADLDKIIAGEEDF